MSEVTGRVSSSPQILLVEDSEDNRGLIKQLVENWMQLSLLEARDGNEGVRLAQEHLPALILMDLSLPMLTGWEAATLLKADARTAHIPIIALTAHAMPGDDRRAREAGCDRYMSKPLILRDLKALIEELLSAGDSV